MAAKVAGGGVCRRRVVAVVGSIVLLALGGYLVLSLTVGSGLATSALSIRWADRRPASDCLASYDGVPWVAQGLVVTCSGEAIAAYRRDTGRVAWVWRPPNRRGILSVEALSNGTDAGIGVVTYTLGVGVGYLAGIDLADGRERWIVPVTPYDASSGVWVGAGRFAVVAWSGGSPTSLRVYDLASGALDWSRPSPAACYIHDATIAASWVYAVASCSGARRSDRLYQFSLRTGAVIANVPLPDGACKAASDYPTLWAIPGYVLSGCSDAREPLEHPDLLVIPVGGVRQRTVSWTGNPPRLDFLSEDLRPPFMAASGDTLYLDSNGDRDVYVAAAIDLRTARLRWYKTISIRGARPNDIVYPLNLVGADSRGALDVIEDVSGNSTDYTGTTAVTLATLAASDGKISYGPGTTHPAGAGDQPLYALAGKLLLSLPAPECVAGGLSGCNALGTLTAYKLGSSW